MAVEQRRRCNLWGRTPRPVAVSIAVIKKSGFQRRYAQVCPNCRSMERMSARPIDPFAGSPSHGSASLRRGQAIDAAHDELRNQLGIYDIHSTVSCHVRGVRATQLGDSTYDQLRN